ncbi:MAG: hypothetical protein ACD_54C00501G0001, partial [uncultured bacterium]
MIQNIGQPRLGRGIDQISRRFARLAHPHIQRTIFLKRKAALGLVDLHRRHAQIQHHAIQQGPGMGVQFREIPRHQPQPVAIF